MKKLISLFLILTLLLCACASPEKKKEEDSSQKDIAQDIQSNDDDGKSNENIEYWISGNLKCMSEDLPENVSTENSPWKYDWSKVVNDAFLTTVLKENNKYKDKNAQAEREFTIDGETRTFYYESSYDRKMNGLVSPIHEYHSTTDNHLKYTTIYVDSKTDMITELYKKAPTEYERVIDNEEKAIKISDELVKELYGEKIFSELKVETVSISDYNKYYIQYFRYVNGYKLFEGMSVTLHASGNICRIFAPTVGICGDSENIPSKEAIDEAYSLLYASVKEEYLDCVIDPRISVSTEGIYFLSVDFEGHPIKQGSSSLISVHINILKS